MQLKGKRVTVFGLGLYRSGIAAAKLLHAYGAAVTVTDTRPAEALSKLDEPCSTYRTFFGGHPTECIADADLIVVSPGVPLDIPILREARTRQIPILSELEVAANLCSAPIVAITGTKGKSTTTLLAAAILEGGNSFPNVSVAGNIGVPLAAEVQKLTSQDIVVVETSSFQLESTVTFHPRVSVVLNLSRDHLDRHRTMAAYRAAKQKISKNQTAADWIVLNGSDTSAKDFASATKAKIIYFTDKGAPESTSTSAVFRENSKLFSHWNGTRKIICEIEDVPLPGAHNVQNVLAAIAVGLIFGVTPAQIRRALRRFKRSHPAFSHAFEPLKTVAAVAFIDDSKATNVAAVKAALESIEDTQIILIMGGYDKGNDYTPLREIIRDRVKVVVMLGEYTQAIENGLATTTDIVKARTMTEAVQIAYKRASPGDVVLLSPANASFDMYRDYKARGADFKAAVDALQSPH